MSEIEDILVERGSRYGSFKSHSMITQGLKDCMEECPQWPLLAPYHKEALEMIQHKIGRVLNGDPDYLDSWDDIAGYATLVSKIIKGENP